MTLLATTACAHPQPKELKGLDQAATNEGKNIFVDTIEVMSQAMGRTIKNVVVLPSSYIYYTPGVGLDKEYPVLYLLHGAYGCYSDWSKKTNLQELATQYDIIIVCPDGQDSWYFDSPVDPKMQFETYVSKELVSYIDSHYHTVAHRFMRAITGLSMGGHGSLFLAFRHPDVFWSCGSMSGNMDITQYPDKWHIKDRLGEYADNKQRWHDHAVCNLVDLLVDSPLQPCQNILIDEGLKDIFYKNNVELHQQLVEKGIDHDFVVRPGAHTWTYWVNALDYHLLFFSKAFKRGAELIEKEQNPSN